MSNYLVENHKGYQSKPCMSYEAAERLIGYLPKIHSYTIKSVEDEYTCDAFKVIASISDEIAKDKKLLEKYNWSRDIIELIAYKIIVDPLKLMYYLHYFTSTSVESITLHVLNQTK